MGRTEVGEAMSVSRSLLKNLETETFCGTFRLTVRSCVRSFGACDVLNARILYAAINFGIRMRL